MPASSAHQTLSWDLASLLNEWPENGRNKGRACLWGLCRLCYLCCGCPLTTSAPKVFSTSFLPSLQWLYYVKLFNSLASPFLSVGSNKPHFTAMVIPWTFFFFFFFFFVLFAISWVAPAAYGGSQARGLIGAVATGLHQSHSNMGSEPCLQPTPQLTATPDP